MNTLAPLIFASLPKDFSKFFAALQHLGFSQFIQLRRVDSQLEYLLSILSDTKRCIEHSGFSQFGRSGFPGLSNGSGLAPNDLKNQIE
jgi:hypothetical protein